MKKRERKLLAPIWGVHVAVAIFLIGTGDVGAQSPRKDAAQVGRTKPAPQTKHSRPDLGADEVSDARRRLAELGYWVRPEGAADEVSLRHSLIAFQKVEGRPRTGVMTQDEFQALRAARRPATRESGYAHVEIDLCRQVLFLIEVGDIPLRILPVSTGSGACFTEGGRTRQAITPVGRFTIKRKIKGWHK